MKIKEDKIEENTEKEHLITENTEEKYKSFESITGNNKDLIDLSNKKK